MSSISRRSVLQAFVASAFAARTALGQTPSRPRPLASDAVTSDWPTFLGPTHDGVSTETRLNRELPPPLIWEFARGTGYTSPVVVGERLVLVHRIGEEEIIECLHAETGASQWQFRYTTAFEVGTGTTTGHGRVPLSTASGSTQWGPKGRCIAWSSHRER